MPRRLRERAIHAARFALPTTFAVYLLGAAWNAADVFLFGGADPELGAARTFWFDERQWRIIALVVGVVVFLWKVGDMARTRPSWRYALAFSLWLAVATVWTAVAMMNRDGWLAVGVVAFAVGSWLLYRRRVPGRPVPTSSASTVASAGLRDQELR